jgi:hypothetical protein
MSIYDYEPRLLPQVKILTYQKTRLVSFLNIFNRTYADFIRDLCDANIKWFSQDISQTFDDHAYGISHLIIKRYIENTPDVRPIKEQLNAHTYPYPHKIIRLPSVPVSKWQAENLYQFLTKYSRTFADFIRAVCDNIYVDFFEAQAQNLEFGISIERIYERAVEDLCAIQNKKDPTYRRQWPTGYWEQRNAVQKRNQSLGIPANRSHHDG